MVTAEPQRTCVGCKQVSPVSTLVRVTADQCGRLQVSPTGPGRGAWLCARSPECLERALAKRAFERALGRQVGSSGATAVRQSLVQPQAG